MRNVFPYLLIGVGGFLGANARFAVGSWAASTFGTRFPIGTLLVNVAGCFLIGILGTLISDRLTARPDVLQWFLAIGFLGSFTTFSSFAWENHQLLFDREWFLASLYVGVSVVAGLIAVRFGVIIARAW